MFHKNVIQNLPSKKRFTAFLNFLFIAISAFYFTACRKDSLSTTNDISVNPKTISVEEARSWFISQYGEKHSINLSQINQKSFGAGSEPASSNVVIAPSWTEAETSNYLNSSPLLIVPVQSIEAFDIEQSGYSLIFYRDSTHSLKTTLQVYIPDSAYLQTHEILNVNDFSGVLYQVDMKGKGRRFFLVENGKFTARGYVMGRPNNALKVRLEGDEEDVCLDGDPDCPSAAGSRRSWVSRALSAIVNFFTSGSISNNSGNSTGIAGSPSSSGNIFGGIDMSYGGGGYSNTLSNELDNTLFSQYPGRSYVFSLNISESDKSYLRANTDVWDQVSEFCIQGKRFSKSDKETIISQQLELLQFDSRYATTNQQGGFPSLGSHQWEQDVVKPFLGPELMIQYSVWCAILKHQNPTWPEWKISATAFWNTTKEIIHTGLDICGLVPAAGEPCDLVNGVFYTIEGDGVNATLSFAATLPIAGWVATGTKYAIKTIGISGRTYKLSYKVVNGIIEFGDKDVLRGQLRKILNLSPGDGFIAHHIIPLDKVNNPLAQAAAKYKAAFHPNEFYNGIALTSTVHTGSHQAYSELVERRMDEIYNAFGGINITPQKAHEEIQNLMKRIRTAIDSNPTTNINNLTF